MGAAKDIKIPIWYKIFYILSLVSILFLAVCIYLPLFFLIVPLATLDATLHKVLFNKKLRDPFFKVIVPFKVKLSSDQYGWFSIHEGDTLHVFEVFDRMVISGGDYVCDSGKQLNRYRRSFAQVDHDQTEKDMVIGIDILNLCCKRMEKWHERLY